MDEQFPSNAINHLTPEVDVLLLRFSALFAQVEKKILRFSKVFEGLLEK